MLNIIKELKELGFSYFSDVTPKHHMYYVIGRVDEYIRFFVDPETCIWSFRYYCITNTFQIWDHDTNYWKNIDTMHIANIIALYHE